MWIWHLIYSAEISSAYSDDTLVLKHLPSFACVKYVSIFYENLEQNFSLLRNSLYDSGTVSLVSKNCKILIILKSAGKKKNTFQNVVSTVESGLTGDKVHFYYL